MIQVLFIIAACMTTLEAFIALCSDKVENLAATFVVGIAMTVLSAYSAVALGTFGFVYGIVLASLFGISMFGGLVAGNAGKFIVNCTMMVLFIVGVVQM